MFRRSIVLAAALVAATAGISVAAAPSHAASCPIDMEFTTTYYSDWTHRTVIGQAGYNCDPAFWQWGRTSYHWTKATAPCGGGGGPIR